jgi:hypothetical protein
VRNRCRYGLPHALYKFSASPFQPVGTGTEYRKWCANVILEALNTMADCPHLSLGREAKHFLLEDDELFPRLCDAAGIDGRKFRNHLWTCERGEVTEELLEAL